MPSLRRLSRLNTIYLGVAISLYSASSFANQLEQPDQLEKIEVRSKYQAYRGDFTALQSPEVITLINSSLIKNVGITGLTQALDLSASVSRQNSLGGLWDSYAIRGFFGDEDVPSGYLVNGFNAGRGFSGPRDMSAIESVEVLKGPKSALFGRGEPSGAINLITKKPEFEPQGQISLGMGSRDKRRLDADFTGALTEQVAGRLIGFHETEDGFRDSVETDKQGGWSLFYIK